MQAPVLSNGVTQVGALIPTSSLPAVMFSIQMLQTHSCGLDGAICMNLLIQNEVYASAVPGAYPVLLSLGLHFSKASD